MIALHDKDLKSWCLGVMSSVSLNYDHSLTAEYDGYYYVFRWTGPTTTTREGRVGPAVISQRKWLDAVSHFCHETIPFRANQATRRFVYLNQVSKISIKTHISITKTGRLIISGPTNTVDIALPTSETA